MVSSDDIIDENPAELAPGTPLPPEPTPIYIANGVRILPFPADHCILDDGATLHPVATLETYNDDGLIAVHHIGVKGDGEIKIYALLKEIERSGGSKFFAEVEEWFAEAAAVLHQILPIDPNEAIDRRDNRIPWGDANPAPTPGPINNDLNPPEVPAPVVDPKGDSVVDAGDPIEETGDSKPEAAAGDAPAESQEGVADETPATESAPEPDSAS